MLLSEKRGTILVDSSGATKKLKYLFTDFAFRNFAFYLLLLLGGLLSNSSFGQVTPTPSYPSDVQSVNGVINAFFSSLSGPAGEREWARFRALFRQEAKIHAVQYNAEGSAEIVSGTLDGYLKNIQPFFETHGFYQKELKRTSESYGHMAQIFSSYASTYYFPQSDTALREFGMIGFQLIKAEGRWWIMQAFWNTEGMGVQLSPEFAPGKDQLAPTQSFQTKTQKGGSPDIEQIFPADFVDVAPSFPGGQPELEKYFQQKIAAFTPPILEEKKASISFIVEVDGLVSNVEVNGMLDENLRAYLMESTLKMPSWEPGIKDLNSVRTQFQVNVPLKPVVK